MKFITVLTDCTLHLLAQRISCTITNHPLGMIVVVVVVSIVDKLICVNFGSVPIYGGCGCSCGYGCGYGYGCSCGCGCSWVEFVRKDTFHSLAIT